MIRVLFTIYGRVGRGTWWLGQLCCVCLCIFAIALLFGAASGTGHLVAALALLASVWINVCVTIKRYHDLGKSGAWFAIILVPFIGPIWQMVECGFSVGQFDHNEYGPPPGFGSAHESDSAMPSALASKEIDFGKYRLSEPIVIGGPAVPATANSSQKPAFGKRI